MALLTGTSLRIISSMAHFPFFKMAAVRHLAFLKVGNFNCPYPSEGQSASRAKFCEDRSNRSGDMTYFRFFKMAAAAILDFGNSNF